MPLALDPSHATLLDSDTLAHMEVAGNELIRDFLTACGGVWQYVVEDELAKRIEELRAQVRPICDTKSKKCQREATRLRKIIEKLRRPSKATFKRVERALTMEARNYLLRADCPNQPCGCDECGAFEMQCERAGLDWRYVIDLARKLEARGWKVKRKTMVHRKARNRVMGDASN